MIEMISLTQVYDTKYVVSGEASFVSASLTHVLIGLLDGAHAVLEFGEQEEPDAEEDETSEHPPERWRPRDRREHLQSSGGHILSTVTTHTCQAAAAGASARRRLATERPANSVRLLRQEVQFQIRAGHRPLLLERAATAGRSSLTGPIGRRWGGPSTETRQPLRECTHEHWINTTPRLI